MCNQYEIFDSENWKCLPYSGDPTLFTEQGRLGYEWSSQTRNNELIIDLLFSQKDMSFYFYENEQGYMYENSLSA